MKKQTHQTENSSLSTLSRRQFLQGTAATCLAASMLTACSGSDGGDDYFDSVGHDNVEPKEGTWHYSHCRMCMRGDCCNQYMMVDGVVVEMKGNKESPLNKGAMCPRGHSAIQNLYNPYRIKAPMKRTNPQKGLDQDPGWVEISWEEALSTVSTKLAAIQQKDPRGFAFQLGFGDMDFFESFLHYFPVAFGTPNILTSNGPLCSVHFATDFTQGAEPTCNYDLTHGKYHITMGRSLGMGFATANGHSRGVVDAITAGRTKIVDVNPRLTPEGSKGEWVAIKPGTDLAFLLAMAYTIIFEIGEYDEDFLKWRTNAPYLIDVSTGLYYKVDDKPQMLDAADNTVKPFDAFDSDDSSNDPQLEVDATVNGIPVKSSFTLIKEHLNGGNTAGDVYDADWAENITTIPASTIRRISAEFVEAASIGSTTDIDGISMPLRPASIVLERGAINQEDGTHADLMSKVINMLVGGLEMPGGAIACSRGDALSPGEDGVVAPKHEATGEPAYPPQSLELTEYFIHKHSMPYLAYKVIKNPETYGIDYNVDGLFMVGTNPVASVTEPDVIADSIASIPFVTTLGYHYDESAALSDILLPSNALLERLSVNAFDVDITGYTDDNLGLSLLMYRDPVAPVYNTRQPQDIMMDLAERIGILPILNEVLNAGVMLNLVAGVGVPLPEHLKLDPGTRYSMKEIWERALEAKYGNNINIDYLTKNGIYYEYAPKSECYNSLRFKKGTTRHPIYFERLLRDKEKLENLFSEHNISLPGWNKDKHLSFFEAMVTWRPNPINSHDGNGEYDLIAFNFKITESPFKMGAVDQLPYLNEIGETFNPYYNTVCINPAVAASKSLNDGDIVTVESVNGKLKGRVKLTNMVHPETVGIGGSLGRMVKTLGDKPASNTHYNMLTNGKLDNIDPIASGVINSVAVKVY